jgi:hypothetical protein
MIFFHITPGMTKKRPFQIELIVSNGTFFTISRGLFCHAKGNMGKIKSVLPCFTRWALVFPMLK